MWISGPPGSGKTTLVTDFLSRQPDLRPLWYRIDTGDKDIGTFFYYLGQAAAEVQRDGEFGLPTYSSAFVREPGVFSRRFFQQMYRGLTQPFVLVFENYQLVGDFDVFHQAINVAIENLPPACNVFVISRRPPPAEFSRLIAHDQLGRIRWSDLRLTHGEIRDIAVSYGVTGLGEDELTRLEARSRGWVTGLALLLQNEQPESEFATQSEHRPQILIDYFAREIFSRQSPEIRRCLIRAALLPEISQTMMNEITGCDEFWHTLNDLHERGYFVDYLADPLPLFQFHPLFREFLLVQAERELSAAEICEFREDAGRAAEAAGHLESAIDIFLAAGSFAEVARLIGRVAPQLLRQGRVKTLTRWICALPLDVLEDNPRIEFWLGACRLFESPPAALACFESAFERCRAQGDLSGAERAWAGAVNAVFITWSGFHRLEEWVAKGRELQPGEGEFASAGEEFAFTYAMCMAVVFSEPEHPDAASLVDRVMRLMNRPQSLSQQLMAANTILHHLVWMGQIAKGRILRETVENRIAQSSPSEEQQISWLAAKGQIDIACGDPETALGWAEAGVELSRESGVYIWQHKLRGVAVHANLLLDRPDAARAHLQADARKLPATQNLLWLHHHWLFAWCEWQDGHFGDALERLAAVEVILKRTGWPVIPAAKWRIGLAAVNFEMGEVDNARRHLDEVKPIARTVGSSYLSYQCAIMESIFSLANDDNACVARGRNAMEIGAAADLTFVDWFDRARMSRLCARLLLAGIETEHLHKLIRALLLNPPETGESLEQWPWSIKVYALGSCRILRDEQPVAGGPKRQRKVVDLLKALVAHGADGASEARLAEALWPDSEADAARNSLKTTVHRLRHLLGRPDALRIRDGTISLNRECCWVDAWEFRKLVGTSADAGNRWARLSKGIELYRGPLFAADDESWLLAPREVLQGLVADAVLALGRHRERMEEWESAIEAYQKGLAVDELAEPLYRRLMICHEQLGRHADAMITYERCRRRLDEKLGVDPSRVTQALADEIRHH